MEDKRKEVQDILIKNYQCERMFSELFPILNNEEKKLFDFIRRITPTWQITTLKCINY
jgi:hypothetical protein